MNTDFAEVEVFRFESFDKNHGRLEELAYNQVDVPDEWNVLEDWSGLNTIGLVIRRREVQGKETWESQYYISSLESDAE